MKPDYRAVTWVFSALLVVTSTVQVSAVIADGLAQTRVLRLSLGITPWWRLSSVQYFGTRTGEPRHRPRPSDNRDQRSARVDATASARAWPARVTDHGEP